MKEYRLTEVHKIPEDWKVMQMEEIIALKNGEKPAIDNDGSIPVYGANGIMGYTINVLVDNDYTIIIGRVGASGEIHLAQGQIWVSDNAIYSETYSKHNVSMPYLYYLLKFKSLKRFATKTTHPIITQSFLKNYELLLPSFAEQRKIAEILGTVDEAIEKVDKAIEKTERLKKGLMQELLTKGIGHKQFKDTEIGRIPKEWNVLSLEEIINLKSGQYFKFSEFRQNGIRCLKIDNIGFKEILWDTITYLPEDYVDKYGELVLNAEDIVIALNRPIIKNKLKIAQLKENDVPAILYQRVGKIIIKDNSYINSTYLFLVLSGDYFKNKLIRFLIGTDQPYIRTPVFLSIKIPIPGEVEEQQKISGILKIVYNRLKLQKTKKWKLKIIKKGLMNDLLTGRKRVRI